MKIKFVCPNAKCDGKTLDEVMHNVIQSSSIGDIEPGGCVEYAGQSSDGGEVVGYQCLTCGEYVRDAFNCDIADPDGLFDWLLEKMMVEDSRILRIPFSRVSGWNQLLTRRTKLDTVEVDEVIEQYTVSFGNGYEAKIRLVNLEHGPRIDAALYRDGSDVGQPENPGEIEQVDGDYCWRHHKRDFFLRIASQS